MKELRVTLKHVRKAYARPVLTDVNLELNNDSYTAVVGRSGSGKSTLLNILGLVEERDGGEYVFNGRTLGKMLLKTQVMTDDCKPPSLLQCLMRWITFPIDMSLIGLILISRKGKRIGDIASGCNVVKSAMGVVGKVSSEGYFDFADPGYKPRHPNAYTLSDKDRELVRKAVHNRLYKAYRKEVAEHISDVLRIVRMEDDLEFLAHIEQDCKYFDNLGGGAERAAGGEAAS